MNTRLENLVLSGLVALVVSVAVSGASPTPIAKPTHGISTAALHRSSGPSLAEQLAALRKRVDAVQNRESVDRRVINDVALQAQEASDVAGCIDGAYYVMFDQQGNVVEGGSAEAGSFVVPTLDPQCVSEDA